MTRTNRIPLVADCASALALGGETVRSDDEGVTIRLGQFVRTITEDEAKLASKASARLARLARGPGGEFDPGRTVLVRAMAEREIAEQILGDRPRLIFFPAGGAGGFYRMRFPACILDEAGKFSIHIQNAMRLETLAENDVIWIQVDCKPETRNMAKAAQRMGVKVVYEMDDAYWCIPPHNDEAAYWTPDRLLNVEAMLKLADVVVTTTQKLAAGFSRLAKRVEIAPNFIPAKVWPKAGRRTSGRIIWAGSPSHKHDLDMLVDPLRRIMEGRPETHLIIFGVFVPPALQPFGRRIQLVDWVEFERYPEMLASLDAAVGIAPLIDDEFNNGRSAIKAYEYALCGYNVVTSRVGEYPDVIRHGENGWLAGTPEEWERSLKEALTDAEMPTPKSAALADWVRKERNEDACLASWNALVERILV